MRISTYRARGRTSQESSVAPEGVSVPRELAEKERRRLREMKPASEELPKDFGQRNDFGFPITAKK